MEQKEMMETFNRLYNHMANSNEPRYMHIFGETMKCMMKDMISMKPELGQEYLDKLKAIEWSNYLTKKETMAIVGEMTPKGKWDFSTWEKEITEYDLCKEEKTCYNKYALFATMNMIYSDSFKSISVIAGKKPEEMTDEEIFLDIHMLAIDKLKDSDGVFDIRDYFKL